MGKGKRGGNGGEVKRSANAQPKKKSGPLKAIKGVKGRRKDGKLEAVVLPHSQLHENAKQQAAERKQARNPRNSELDQEYEALKQRAASKSLAAKHQLKQTQHQSMLQLAPSTLASGAGQPVADVDPLARHMHELQPDEDYGYADDHLAREQHEQHGGQTISNGTFGILYDESDDEGESKTSIQQPQQPAFSLARPTFSLAQPTFSMSVHSHHQQPQQHQQQQFGFAPQVAAGHEYDDDEL